MPTPPHKAPLFLYTPSLIVLEAAVHPRARYWVVRFENSTTQEESRRRPLSVTRVRCYELCDIWNRTQVCDVPSGGLLRCEKAITYGVRDSRIRIGLLRAVVEKLAETPSYIDRVTGSFGNHVECLSSLAWPLLVYQAISTETSLLHLA